MIESQPISKLQVACELLDSALELYSQSKYFSSLHLAGAAEELFGEYLRRHGRTSSLDSWRKEGAQLVNLMVGDEAWTPESMASRLNYAKNRTKHMNDSGDARILFDPQGEAREILERSVSDFYQLMNVFDLIESAQIRQFNCREPRA